MNVYKPTISKPRKKRKINDLNTSFEDDIPTKSRKRKSKLIDLIFFEEKLLFFCFL
jgi:hypothetical protein